MKIVSIALFLGLLLTTPASAGDKEQSAKIEGWLAYGAPVSRTTVTCHKDQVCDLVWGAGIGRCRASILVDKFGTVPMPWTYKCRAYWMPKPSRRSTKTNR